MFTETPKANPETPAVKKAGKYHALAEAIRRGCKISPVQCRRLTFVPPGEWGEELASCALGAAALAVGFEYDRANFTPSVFSYRLHRQFPELQDRIEETLLMNKIIALNDDRGWSREKIADWLDSL